MDNSRIKRQHKRKCQYQLQNRIKLSEIFKLIPYEILCLIINILNIHCMNLALVSSKYYKIVAETNMLIKRQKLLLNFDFCHHLGEWRRIINLPINLDLSLNDLKNEV